MIDGHDTPERGSGMRRSAGDGNRTTSLTRRIGAAVCTAAVLALIVGVSASPARRPAGQAARAGVEQELRQLIKMPSGPPGAIAVVQRSGRITVYRAGVSDVRTGTQINSGQHMRLASVSKAFSGAVALSLVQRHRLSLRDTIAKLLPKLPRAWGRVTLAEALHHTSGLPDFTNPVKARRLLEYLVAHPHATPSPLFILHFIAGEGLGFKPGSRYEYSNTDNFVVALMAEAATHRDYNRLLASQVSSPLHLRQTSLPRGVAIPSPYIHGYAISPGTAPQDVSKEVSAAYTWASGGIISTPGELNRFARGYAGARLFGRRLQAKQLSFLPGNSEPEGPGANSAGLAIFRYRTRCGTVYGHTGNIFGYTQFMAATLNGRRSVAVSISEQVTDKSMGEKLAVFRRLRAIEEDAVCAALR